MAGAVGRTRSAVVGSVAVGVLLVGGGGAYLAATASHDRDKAAGHDAEGDRPPLLALDGYAPSGAGTAGDAPVASGTRGIAPGEPDPNGAHGVRYRALRALPDGPSTAAVHRSRGTVDADRVSRLAKALGVHGTPRLTEGSWQVGADGRDRTGPTLRVTQQAPGTWSFTRSVPGGEDCARGTVCSGDVTGGQTGRPVGENAAKAAAAPVLKALGQDDAKLDADQLMGSVRVVNADPEVGGLPTFGWSTGVRVGTDGTVIGGSGQVLAPVKGDTYPVLDADRTLDLLNASRQTHVRYDVCPDAGPQEKRDGAGSRSGCATPTGHGPLSKPSVVPVDGAVFGLAAHLVEGRQALVPSWFFEARPKGARDGFTLTYPAVDPAYLASGEGRTPGSVRPAAPGDSSKVHITSYTTSGRSLTVRFYGGVCSTYTAAADEAEDRVTVTVTEHPQHHRKACIMIAKEMTKTVTLKRPLDDRKVVDSTGATVRRG